MTAAADRSATDDGLALPAEWWTRLGHDLRGPLGPMRMAVQLLRSGRGEEAERQEALLVLDRQIDRLLGEIEDAADLMRLRNGAFALRLRDGDLNLVLDAMASRVGLRRMLDERGQVLDCAPGPIEMVAHHDAARLCVLLDFLLRKASASAGRGDTLRVALQGGADAPALAVSGFTAGMLEDAEIRWLLGVPGADAVEVSARGVLVRETARLGGVGIDAQASPPQLVLRIPGAADAT